MMIHLAGTCEVRKPTSGISSITPNPPGVMTSPAFCGGIALKVLEELGNQHGAAEKDEPCHEHRDVAR